MVSGKAKRKEGESFKKFLVRILQTNSANQTDAITDGVLNTTTKTPLEPNLLSGDLDETTNNTSTHINSSVYNGYCCESRIDSKVLKVIKSDVAALQTQMNSVNTIIDSTNAIIESMSAILIPSGPESGRVFLDSKRFSKSFRNFKREEQDYYKSSGEVNSSRKRT